MFTAHKHVRSFRIGILQYELNQTSYSWIFRILKRINQMAITVRGILDSGLGMVIGAVTGLLVPLCQIPLAYYLFAKNMRDVHKQNWFVTILTTLTIGSVTTLVAAGLALIFTLANIFYGMKVGLLEGSKEALILPYTVFRRMAKSVDNDTPATWKDSPIGSIVSTVFYFMSLGSFSMMEVFVKPLILAPMDRRHAEQRAVIDDRLAEIDRENSFLREKLAVRERQDAVLRDARAEGVLHSAMIDIGRMNELEALIARITTEITELQKLPVPLDHADSRYLEIFQQTLQIVQATYDAGMSSFAIKTRNNELLEQIKPLDPQERKGADLLTVGEMAEFKKYIDELPEGEKKKEEIRKLEDYSSTLAATCVLSYEPIEKPVIVKSNAPPYLSFMYEYDSLKDWIETENDHTKAYKPIRHAINPPTTEEVRSMKIYTSYADYFGEFLTYVRNILKEQSAKSEEKKQVRSNARLRLFDPTYEEPAPTSVPTASPSSPASKIKPSGTGGNGE